MSAAAASAMDVNAVIGVHDGHNASVAVVRDGTIELAIQEERFTRVKNQGDAPRHALDAAFTQVGAGARTVPLALNGYYLNYGQWQREKIVQEYQSCSGIVQRARQSFKNTFVDRVYQRHKMNLRERQFSGLGVARERLQPVEHHLAHATAAYATSPWPDERVLVLTCDGSGDRLSATVHIGEGGRLSRAAQVSEHDSLGRLYALVTRYLGMVPLEHEYKVMGLAPYCAGAVKEREASQLFAGLFEFTRNPMVWRRAKGVPSLYAGAAFLERALAGRRFDFIAAGAQAYVERMLVEWTRNCIRETGIRKVACAGGVFMNVKANLRLLEIPELEGLHIFPSCGDESNSVGAALHVASQLGHPRRPLGAIYFGESIGDTEAEVAIEAQAPGKRWRATYCVDIERKAAEALAAGKIVARAKGGLEFGARALGNRSILARADAPGVVRIINEMVKGRDFWMPFAPSVLAERAGEYYLKPKPVKSPYMMFAFASRPEKRHAFAAAQHPYDFTTRPHEVYPEHNPDYYRLLKEFEACTGEGILLNTSFNLHGEPIVYRASDAVNVFARSGLEYMALGNWWVEKRP